MSTAVSVDELQRAWAAVTAGEFRGAATRRASRTATRWQPDEPVVAVAGAGGRVGASTIAVATATAAQRRVRVIECGPMHATGLAAATTAELGVTATGWRQASRDQVLIERTTRSIEHPDDVPMPETADCDLTLIDVSWDLTRLAHSGSWLASTVETAPLIIVTVATVPGLRALDNALQLTNRPEATWCVVVGPRPKKWPKPLHLATTAAITGANEAGRLLTVPDVSSVALTGLTPEPLPPHLVTACRPIVEATTAETPKGHDHHVRL